MILGLELSTATRSCPDPQVILLYQHLIEGSSYFNLFSKALDILHAERIGHGYHVLEDNALYKRIIDERIHLEVSKRDQHK